MGGRLSVLVAMLGLLALAGCGGGGEAGQPVQGVETPVPLAEPIRVPHMDAAHIPVGQPFLEYNSNPPTSGPHWGIVAPCGVYPKGLPNEQIVHNLEHGNVVISHSLQDQGEVDRLTDLVQRLPEWGRWGILRFYPDMPQGQVALTAWGVLLAVRGVDEASIRGFWEAYAHNRLSGETQAVGPIPCAQ